MSSTSGTSSKRKLSESGALEEQEGDSSSRKRVQFLESSEQDEEAGAEDEPNEGSDNAEDAHGQPDEPSSFEVDPKQQEIDELAKEFDDEKDEFEVVIGPVNAVEPPKDGAEGGEGGTAAAHSGARRPEGLPAFRFSGSSLTASLWLPITPEQEEALRVTGVTPSNYAQRLNPGGRNAKRRSALEDDLDEIEHQKWRDPGAVQSDFFNYGLNEQTWKEYAARQVALRLYRLQNLQQGGHGTNEQAEYEHEED